MLSAIYDKVELGGVCDQQESKVGREEVYQVSERVARWRLDYERCELRELTKEAKGEE